jgi:hypothetical protein
MKEASKQIFDRYITLILLQQKMNSDKLIRSGSLSDSFGIVESFFATQRHQVEIP